MRRLLVLAASVAVALLDMGCGDSSQGQESGSTAPAPAQAATEGRWVIRDLGTLGGRWSEAIAINDHGQVVGRAATKTSSYRAFLWQNGKMTDLGALGPFVAMKVGERRLAVRPPGD